MAVTETECKYLEHLQQFRMLAFLEGFSERKSSQQSGEKLFHHLFLLESHLFNTSLPVAGRAEVRDNFQVIPTFSRELLN